MRNLYLAVIPSMILGLIVFGLGPIQAVIEIVYHLYFT